MKTLNKILGLFLVISLFIFAGCEDVDKSYTGTGFIHFDQSSVSAVESSTDIITVSVLLADKPASAPITVAVDVDLVAQGVTQTLVEGVDFEVIAPADLTSVTIPAGENSAEIQIAVFDNLVEDSAKYINLTLAGAGDYIMGFPGSELNKSVSILISDDDCAMLADNWTGVPVGIETYSNWPTFTAAAQWSVSEIITPVKIKYLVKGLMNGIFTDWAETITNGGDYYITLDFTDALNPAVTLEAGQASPEGFDNYGYYATTDDTWSYYIIPDPLNASTFSTCDKTLSIYYLVDISTDGAPLDGNLRSCKYIVTFE